MTENETIVAEKPASPPKEPAKVRPTQKKSINWSLRILLIGMVFIFGVLITLYFMPQIKQRLPIVATWIGENNDSSYITLSQDIAAQQKLINSLSQRSDLHEQRLNDLSNIAALTTEAVNEPEAPIAAVPKAEPTAADPSQSARVDMLLSRMSQLEASFVPLSKNMIDASTTNKQLSALEQQSITVTDKIINMESRLLAVEKFAAKDNSALLLSLKIDQLKRKVSSGLAYDSELSAVETLITKSRLNDKEIFTQTLQILRNASDKGLLTPPQLQANFVRLIPSLLATDGLTPDLSWWQKTLNSIKNLISIRKTDGTSYSDNGLDPLIIDIEQWLKEADLKRALQSFEALPQTAKIALNLWKSDVEAWLQCQQALNRLEGIAWENYLTPTNNDAPIPAPADGDKIEGNTL